MDYAFVLYLKMVSANFHVDLQNNNLKKVKTNKQANKQENVTIFMHKCK